MPPVPRGRLARTPVLWMLLLILLAGCDATPPGDTLRTRRVLAGAMRTSLQDNLLDAWYPRTVDSTHGGYLSRFTYAWEPEEPQDKMIVTQARHTWTTARVALFNPAAATTYRALSAHGFAFLQDAMWDSTYGGFYTLVRRDGLPPDDNARRKTAYGNAFGTYGLAAYYAASGDAAALRLARDAFLWLETHSHDPVHGGYFQFLDRDGTAHPEGQGNTPPKDQNSSIHLLEAFTELYNVWPDSLLGVRLEEMLHLIRDTMVAEPGYLQLFFAADWTPLSYRDSTAAVREAHRHLDHVSFGHDVETAFLMLEAAEALGRPLDPPTFEVARRMVDHALAYGWDASVGGFYDGAYYLTDGAPPEIIMSTKNWWAQAEGLNTLLLMSDLVPESRERYYGAFTQLWSYVQTYLIDPEHGGWYDSGLDRSPESRTALKAHIWKGPYHTARGLMRCIERLEDPVTGEAALAGSAQ